MRDLKNEWRQSLFEQDSLTRDEIEELEGHLEDSMGELSHLNLDEDERLLVAAHRIGHPVALGKAFSDIPGKVPGLARPLQVMILAVFAYSSCGLLASA